MPAFSTKRVSAIKAVIRRLTSRIINSYRADFTTSEMLELYTRPKDREILTKVFELVQLDQSSNSWAHPLKIGDKTVNLRVHLNFAKDDQKWLVPRYASHGPVDGANPEVRAKFEKWMTRRVELGYECALIEAVFDELNWRCTAAGLEFFMPSIIDILGMIENDPKAQEQREKLSVAKVPALPSLPLGMDGVLPGIKATVARARLMDKKSEERSDTAKVRFTLSSSGSIETPWGTTISML